MVSRPALFELLGSSARVVHVSAPAGSGKTVLVRSWLQERRLEERAAWISVRAESCDPERRSAIVLDALHSLPASRQRVGGLPSGPGRGGAERIERLLAEASESADPLWLVIDEADELQARHAAELESVLSRGPPQLHVLLLSRRRLRLGLHQLRLRGELTEIGSQDLRFTEREARQLFCAVGVSLSDRALTRLHARTDGWVGGLRLIADALDRHPDPERFAEEFSGCDRNVAEYLRAEVLDQLSGDARRLLLRTSILEEVGGDLADHLTGAAGGERVLQDLEEANAFVCAVDGQRSLFRYHPLFADLLRLELRRACPEEVAEVHGMAAEWFADNGDPIRAVRHALAGRHWTRAAGLLLDHWLELYVEGKLETAHEVLSQIPGQPVSANPELAALRAGDELIHGSLHAAAEQLAATTLARDRVPPERRERLSVMLDALQLIYARQRKDLPAAMHAARRLLRYTRRGCGRTIGDDVAAMTLLNVGTAEAWTARRDEAEQHLELAIEIARRSQRSYLEVAALGQVALQVRLGSFQRSVDFGMHAIYLASQHGWTRDPLVTPAYVAIAAVRVWQGLLDESEEWLEGADVAGGAEGEPATAVLRSYVRGLIELARGDAERAHSAFDASARHAATLVTPHLLAVRARAYGLQALLEIEEISRVSAIVGQMSEAERSLSEMRVTIALLRLAEGDARAAKRTLSPALERAGAERRPGGWMIHGFLVQALACEALDDVTGAAQALEEGLALAKLDGAILPFLLHRCPRLLERHGLRRPPHAEFVAGILGLLPETQDADRQPAGALSPAFLSESEVRVLRYLSTNLSAPEIAAELYLSVNTVKSHLRHLYGKLSVHHRREAVERARSLGLLAAPSPCTERVGAPADREGARRTVCGRGPPNEYGSSGRDVWFA
ncbi:MAG: LuxR family transcriptional regulator [Acidimicrobiaceae bacterium]|nr:LuxR family transcriptional regulator [Acidimicrobiaceae bacterium]